MASVSRRSVTSLFSNLVTRPTGQAIRMGVESQLAELDPPPPGVRVSVLDFSGVRVLDFSCADEIVAKLLLRYAVADAPFAVYVVVRGIAEHHQEAIEAVLERHGLLVVAEDPSGSLRLLGAADVLLGRCWNTLLRLERATAAELGQAAGMHFAEARAAAAVLCDRRVALRASDGAFLSLATLLRP